MILSLAPPSRNSRTQNSNAHPACIVDDGKQPGILQRTGLVDGSMVGCLPVAHRRSITIERRAFRLIGMVGVRWGAAAQSQD